MTFKLSTRLTITHLCATLLTILIFTVTIGMFTGYLLEKYADTEIAYLVPLNKILTVLALVSILLTLCLNRWARKGIDAELAKIGELISLVAQKKDIDPVKFVSPSEEVEEVLESIRCLAISLEEKEQVRKRMTIDLAHELRTPLTTLQVNLEGLLEGVWQPTRERLNSCHEEILRIIRLVGGLEQLAKYDADQIKLNLTTFDLGELVRNIYLNFQGAYRQKGVELKFAGKSEKITGDRDKISQLLVNLLSNSLKYTSAGGRVMLMISGGQDFVNLVLNDSGAGIPPEDLNRVFDRLYRADISRTRTTGGSGIGLAIAKAIVESHRGSINIVSQLGAGTEVTVVLPRNYENTVLPKNNKE